ncbi:MAG: hypothetical protein AB7O50_15135 [Pseudolabrys sp.]
MSDIGPPDDIAAIKALIARQFHSLSWSNERPADWAGFARDFAAGAALYPAARPVAPQSLDAFIARMKGLAAGVMQSFDETVLGVRVIAFGNVAVAAAAGEFVENGTTVTRNVEMMLLVKDAGAWSIVAQGWDRVTPERPLPPGLVGNG